MPSKNGFTWVCVHHDLVELRVGGGESDEPAYRSGEGGGELRRINSGRVCGEHARQRGRQEAEEVIHRGGPQRSFRLEVIVDLRLVRLDSPRDRTRRRTVEPLGAELDEGRLQQSLPDVAARPAEPGLARRWGLVLHARKCTLIIDR
jgi:hypothetical protein